MTENDFAIRLEELKQAFNRSFSIAPETLIEEQDKVLIFSVSDEMFSVPLEYIKEIIKVPHITKVPLAPPVIIGIMNLNGEIISVSDLAVLFGLKGKRRSASNRIIVTKNLNFETGFLVDAILGIIHLKENVLQPPLNTVTTIRQEFIEGKFYYQDSLITLLNLIELMKTPEMQIG